jgi:protein O-mannosyl-transferase
MIDTQMNSATLLVYHLSNLLYHILTVIVLFFLLRKLGIEDNKSFFISLLFSVHPLFTDAIAWIPGRGDLLAVLFCSISFLSFMYYDSTKNRWFFFFHSAAFLLALFSKEISVFLPIAMIYCYWFCFNNKYKIKALVPFLLAWNFSVFSFFFFRYINHITQKRLSFGAFINNLKVIPTFLGKLVIPLNLSPLPISVQDDKKKTTSNGRLAKG